MLGLFYLMFSLPSLLTTPRHFNFGIVLLDILLTSCNFNSVTMAPVDWHQSTNTTSSTKFTEPPPPPPDFSGGANHKINFSLTLNSAGLVPDFMRQLYQQYQWKMKNFTMKIEGNDRNLGDIDLIKSQRLIDIQHNNNQNLIKLKFKPSTEFPQSQYTLLSRTLRCHQNLFPRQFHTRTHHINKSSDFFSIIRAYNNKMTMLRELLITENSFDRYGWLIIDLKKLSLYENEFVLKVIGTWRRVGSKFHKLRITNSFNTKFPSQPSYHANLILILKTAVTKDTVQSDLEKHLETQLLKRRKRDAESLSRKRRGENEDDDAFAHLCQRRPLKVNFKDVGWDRWVIAPQSYNAYYCGGKCPYPLSDHYHPTNHAIIQLLVHGVKDSSVPRPCCIPYQLDPHTILYLNNDGDAVLQEYRDMSVRSCSCN